VIRKRYRPWDDGETVIILKLRGFEGKSDDNHVAETWISMGREPSSGVGHVDEVIGYGAALRRIWSHME